MAKDKDQREIRTDNPSAEERVEISSILDRGWGSGSGRWLWWLVRGGLWNTWSTSPKSYSNSSNTNNQPIMAHLVIPTEIGIVMPI
jgi:hypothetical protein